MTYYKHGDWNAVCDSCGFQFKASQLRKRWDGFMVCKDDWEARHPLDFIKTPRERISTPWARPTDGTENLGTSCTLEGRQARADYGTADCARVGITSIYTQLDF